MSDVWLDLRVGFRTLLKRPGFLVAAVVTLGLGIGANTAIFSVVNAVLLRPLPYPGSDRIVRIVQHRPAPTQPGGLPARLAALSTDDLQAWRTRTGTLSHMAAYGPAPAILTGRDEPVTLPGARVSPALFPLLGVPPLMGRTFEAAEEKPGADAVAVLSFTAWQKYFAADPDILTRTLILDGRAHVVLGVMPQGFEFPDRQAEIWRPFVLTPTVVRPGERMVQIAQVIARVRGDVPLEQAAAEANVIFRQLRQEEGRLEADGPGRGGLFGAPGAATIELATLRDDLVRPVRGALLVLVVSVGFVLLIACANVANLLLARAMERQQEIAVRSALGATRGRIVRQVLTESLGLAALGSVAGLALAWAGIEALRVLGPADIPRLADVRVDGVVFGFTIGLSVLTGAVFGAMPALRLSRVSQMLAIKQGQAAASAGLGLFGQHRTRSLLAVSEIGLAMVLLVGAGLLINSFQALAGVNPGYDPKNVLAFQVGLPEARYSAAQRSLFYGQLLEQLESMPSVTAAALSNTLPLQQGIVRISLDVEGRPEPTRPEDMTVADVRVISPGYLAAMGIRLVEGRALDRDGGAGRPQELLVNQSFARRYLAGNRTVGARVHLDGPDAWTIAGVVDDVRHAGLTAEPLPEIYVDYRQVAAVMPRGLRDAFFTMRSSDDPARLVAMVRGAVRQLDAELVVDNVATMEQRLATSIAQPRFYATLAGTFAVIALVLAAVGVYGVLAYAVNQCRREIGIRMALGASRSAVLSLVLRQGSAVAAIGMVAGIAGAALMARSLDTLLFGLTPLDLSTFAAASAILAVVAVAACGLPAWRATSIDPIEALRQQ